MIPDVPLPTRRASAPASTRRRSRATGHHQGGAAGSRPAARACSPVLRSHAIAEHVPVREGLDVVVLHDVVGRQIEAPFERAVPRELLDPSAGTLPLGKGATVLDVAGAAAVSRPEADTASGRGRVEVRHWCTTLPSRSTSTVRRNSSGEYSVYPGEVPARLTIRPSGPVARSASLSTTAVTARTSTRTSNRPIDTRVRPRTMPSPPRRPPRSRTSTSLRHRLVSVPSRRDG